MGGATRAGPRRYARHRPFLPMRGGLAAANEFSGHPHYFSRVFMCLGDGIEGVGASVPFFGARLKDCGENRPKTALFGAVLARFWDVTRRVWARIARPKWEKSF